MTNKPDTSCIKKTHPLLLGVANQTARDNSTLTDSNDHSDSSPDLPCPYLSGEKSGCFWQVPDSGWNNQIFEYVTAELKIKDKNVFFKAAFQFCLSYSLIEATV